MADSLITFIIPSINRASLQSAVDSLLDQVDPRWRAVIIYDGVQGREFEDPRIRCFSVEKLGGFGAHHGMAGLVRNIGITKAHTQWIGFLDDDDRLDPRYVAKLSSDYSDFDFVLWRMRFTTGQVIPRDGDDEIRFGNVGISFCYKNKFGNLKFQTNRDGEDFDFLMQLKKKTTNYAVSTEVMYYVGN